MSGVDTLRSFITPNRWKSWERPHIPALADSAIPAPQEIDFTRFIWYFSPHADLPEVKAADVLQLEPWERVAVICKLEQICRSYPAETAGCWCAPCAIVQIPAAILASLLIEELLIPDEFAKDKDYRYEAFEAMSRMNWWCFKGFRFEELLADVHETEKGGCRRFYRWIENYAPPEPNEYGDDMPSIQRIKRQEIAAGIKLLKETKAADVTPFLALVHTEEILSRLDNSLRRQSNTWGAPEIHDFSHLNQSSVTDAKEARAFLILVEKRIGFAFGKKLDLRVFSQKPLGDWMYRDVSGYPQEQLDEALREGESLPTPFTATVRMLISRLGYVCPNGPTRNDQRSSSYIFLECALRLLADQAATVGLLEKMKAVALEHQGPFANYLALLHITGCGAKADLDEGLTWLARSGEIDLILQNLDEGYARRGGMPYFKNFSDNYHHSEIGDDISKFHAQANDLSQAYAWRNLGYFHLHHWHYDYFYCEDLPPLDDETIRKIEKKTYELLWRMIRAAEAAGVTPPSINPLVLARITDRSPIGLSEINSTNLGLDRYDGDHMDWRHWVSDREIHWNAFFAFESGRGAPFDLSEAFVYLAIIFEADRAIPGNCEPEKAKEILRQAANPLLAKSSFDVDWNDDEHDPYSLKGSVTAFLERVSMQEVAQAVERLRMLPKHKTGNHGSWATVYDEVNRRCFGHHYDELTILTLAKIQELGDKQVIVDFGAGTGRLSIPLAKAGHKVIAVEPSAAMLEQLRIKAAGIDSMRIYKKTLGTSGNLTGGGADLALAVFTVIAYIITPAELIQSFTNAGRCLKAKGKLLIDIPSEALFRDRHVTLDGLDRKITFTPLGANLYDYEETTTLSDNGIETKYDDKFRLRYWTEEEVKAALHEAGLEILEDWSGHFPMAGAEYWLCAKIDTSR
jgi:SAM-dependent methyltransferase